MQFFIDSKRSEDKTRMLHNYRVGLFTKSPKILRNRYFCDSLVRLGSQLPAQRRRLASANVVRKIFLAVYIKFRI